jgi:hypothetical protein
MNVTLSPIAPPIELIALAEDAVRLHAGLEAEGEVVAGGVGLKLDAYVVPAADVHVEAALSRPGQLLTEKERRACEAARDALVLRSAVEASPRIKLAAAATAIDRLVGLGATAVLLPAARRIVGREALLASLLPALAQGDGWLRLFVQQYAISDGCWVWCHTHGLEHFGLPDLEVRVAVADLPTAERLIQAAIDHLLARGELPQGARIDAVESDSLGAVPFVVYPARVLSDHSYGPLGALQLVLSKSLESGADVTT